MNFCVIVAVITIPMMLFIHSTVEWKKANKKATQVAENGLMDDEKTIEYKEILSGAMGPQKEP